MLTTCEECGLQVSTKAISCPHCGFVMQPNIKPRATRKSNRRKRLPNGFGQISEIKGRNLRKPFRAMVTVGKNSVGRPICKPLKPESFFETYNDAYAALIEYNKNPYDLDSAISVFELYNKWTDYYFKTLKSESSVRTITSAWAYCSSVYDMRVKDLRARHIKGCMDEGVKIIRGKEHIPTASIKERIKSMFNLMLDYALEYELVDRNYSRTFNVSDDIVKEIEESRRGHIIYSQEEISKLWEHVDDIAYVDILLIQCYSGWRPQELGLILMSNTDLKNWSFIGGMKSDAGRDRFVPIHTKIRALVKRRYEEALSIGSEYLFNCTDAKTHRSSIKLTYDKYSDRVEKIVKRLDLNPQHRAHDGRMHFVTACKRNGVDEYAIKYMVGHAINDVTEKVYTDRDNAWLYDEIEKIK